MGLALGLSAFLGEESNYYIAESYEHQALFLSLLNMCLLDIGAALLPKNINMTVMDPHKFLSEFKTVSYPCLFSKSLGLEVKGDTIQKGRVLIGGPSLAFTQGEEVMCLQAFGKDSSGL